MQRGRQNSVAQNVGCVDEASHTGRYIQVTDVCLGGSDGAELLRTRTRAEGLRECRQFNWIAKRCPGTVRFDIANRFGPHSSSFLRHCDDARLSLNTGRGEADL